MHPILTCLLLTILYLIPLYLNLSPPHFDRLTRLAILGIAFLLSFAIYYNQFYRPFIKKNKDYVDTLLGELFYVLDKKIREIRPQINNLRMNVMTLRRNIFRPWERYLEMAFYYGEYDLAEIEQEYGIDIGCSGAVLYENTQIYYDSILQHETLRRMTPTQRKITDHVESILSTPIYSPRDEMQRRPIAVLNLDSMDHVDITGFNDIAIQEIAAKFAALIGGQLI